MGYSIKHYVVGPVMTNCYLMCNDEKKDLIVVDPGASGDRLAAEIKSMGYSVAGIILTHGHFDHADGIEELKASFSDDIRVYACDREKETLSDPAVNLSAVMGGKKAVYAADVFLSDGEETSMAGFTFKTIHTPGHTPGGCCFYFPEQGVLFSGDTLFCGSVGRTDFPGGSMSVIVRSIREKLLILPEETTVYPGHDAVTTIADEKRYNPYL